MTAGRGIFEVKYFLSFNRRTEGEGQLFIMILVITGDNILITKTCVALTVRGITFGIR